MPEPVERFVLVGYDAGALGIVETTDVRVVRAADVDLQFARDEGEGFETVAPWRAAHESFWVDGKITDDTFVVCERFGVVERY
ncbi:MAG TPA: ASCH domain-containing protein [Candidatus Dormibacteraeota bacterium]|nr:ASCH domain-containing protein [Candidatus Dormibacteraeota bacterium]